MSSTRATIRGANVASITTIRTDIPAIAVAGRGNAGEAQESELKGKIKEALRTLRTHFGIGRLCVALKQSS